jgi:glycosyltransferase involved in cell wall biosynthesis
MPAYNVAPYIGAALESVLAQSHRDLELIVVDDGSTDETRAIADEFARRDSRIRVLHRRNGGISAARNTALAASASPLIAILDSDDVWDPGYLEAQLAILAGRPDVDVVTANALFLGGAGDGRPARPFPDGRPAPDLAAIIADETSVFIMSVFRRRVYETIGGFDEALRTNEDYDYWLRAALAGFRFVRNDRPLGRYRRRGDSLSSDDVRMVRGILRVFEKHRPGLAGRPREAALADAQIARFSTLRHEVEARHALATRDYTALADHVAALHARRGGARLAVARVLARWTPRLLARAYRMRQTLRAA